VRADIERFGIDKLIAADPGGHAGRPCAFAVQVPELGSVGFNGPSSFGGAYRARYGVSPSGRCRVADDRSPLGNERVSPLTSAKRSDDASRKPIDLHVASPTRSRPDQGNSHG
jgi:hypothetical protein